jgi:acyl carrier protein phosphodiesterase
VNYFGHAAVASWSTDEPQVLLGAMLPDFATMSGARIANDGAHEDGIGRGIAIHHATDATFHTLPVVTGLMRDLDTQLAERGCARGPRRAVAHIGVELLLDGVLVDEPGYRAAYTRAIADDRQPVWREPDDPVRYAALIARLRTYGTPDDLRDPARVTQRLGRMLAHRPLLAPSSEDLVAIRESLGVYKARIDVAAEAVMRAMRASGS